MGAYCLRMDFLVARCSLVRQSVPWCSGTLSLPRCNLHDRHPAHGRRGCLRWGRVAVFNLLVGANMVWRTLEPGFLVPAQYAPVIASWHAVCMLIFAIYTKHF